MNRGWMNVYYFEWILNINHLFKWNLNYHLKFSGPHICESTKYHSWSLCYTVIWFNLKWLESVWRSPTRKRRRMYGADPCWPVWHLSAYDCILRHSDIILYERSKGNMDISLYEPDGGQCYRNHAYIYREREEIDICMCVQNLYYV